MEHDAMLEMEQDGAGDPGVEGAVGGRNGGVAGRAARVGVPGFELVERAKRRRFTAEYKLGSCARPMGARSWGRSGRCYAARACIRRS